MIIDVLLVAGIAAGALTSAGVAAGLVTALRAVRRRTPSAAAPRTLGEALGPSGPRGLRERDVLTFGREEVVLESGLVLDEDGHVLRAFRTLGLARAEWVLQLDLEARDVALGRACTDVPDGAVPEALPVDGRVLRVRRRGTARVRPTGTGELGFSSARFSVLDERGGRVLVVLDPQPTGGRIAIVADRLDARTFDVLPGGDVPESSSSSSSGRSA